jgi:hypothetical protein
MTPASLPLVDADAALGDVTNSLPLTGDADDLGRMR